MATILVVDDRAANREVARAALDHGGYTVVEASNGSQALAMARTIQPDLVLTDMVMPGMDGYQFAQELHADADTGAIPVLLYTANYRVEEAEPLAAAYGVAKVISKSVGPLDLLAAVGEALNAGHRPTVRSTAGTGLTPTHLRTVNTKLVEKALALEKSEARFDALADLSPIGIAFGGPDLLATYVNPRLQQIVGAPAEALLGDGWQQCLTRDSRNGIRSSPRDPGPDTTHYGQVEFSDGRVCWLHVTVRLLEDDDHGHGGFVAVVDDVTAVVEAEQRRHLDSQQHEAAERHRIVERFDSLARLSGAVAHDFNNMLNVILSFTDFVTERLNETADTPLTPADVALLLDDLRHVSQAGRRAGHLAHQLLTFGGREIVQPTVLDANTIVEEVRAMVDATAGQQIAVTVRIHQGLHRIRADAAQLSQILLNLAFNARDAMPQSGLLTLTTGNTTMTNNDRRGTDLPAGDYIHISVTDTGEGMTPEILHRAMEPFFTTKPKEHGTGLGLSTAYGIIKQAGGDLILESTPQLGTTAHIYLPATTDETTAHGVPDTAGAPHRGDTILIAEDEDSIRDVVTRILTKAGYHVLAAANGEEALNLATIHNGHIHGVLTDVVMPRMNGADLAASLETLRPGIPVLFMSGYAAPLMTEQGILQPGVAVLGKPFTKDDLLTAITTLLTRQPTP